MTKSKGKSFSLFQDGAKNADKVFPRKSEIAMLENGKGGGRKKSQTNLKG